ncbi:MAG: hypothetical protein HRU20_22260 [Pseudomonadales bacterium]|nr:hypothetical protein [Pseudomonadales bacterium]
MNKFLAFTVLTLSLLATLSSAAFAADTPRAGTSKASVETKYGTPQTKSQTVGEPPISSWEYPEFTVYFEFQHVIHTVEKKQTK